MCMSLWIARPKKPFFLDYYGGRTYFSRIYQSKIIDYIQPANNIPRTFLNENKGERDFNCVLRRSGRNSPSEVNFFGCYLKYQIFCLILEPLSIVHVVESLRNVLLLLRRSIHVPFSKVKFPIQIIFQRILSPLSLLQFENLRNAPIIAILCFQQRESKE